MMRTHLHSPSVQLMVTFLNFEVSGLNSITGDIVHPHSFMHWKEMQTGLPQMAGSQELGR